MGYLFPFYPSQIFTIRQFSGFKIYLCKLSFSRQQSVGFQKGLFGVRGRDCLQHVESHYITFHRSTLSWESVNKCHKFPLTVDHGLPIDEILKLTLPQMSKLYRPRVDKIPHKNANSTIFISNEMWRGVSSLLCTNIFSTLWVSITFERRRNMQINILRMEYFGKIFQKYVVSVYNRWHVDLNKF